jgi:hypothetical protein
MENTSRRDFIRKTALAATGLSIGGLAFSAKSYARIAGSNERINLAVMGTNSRGAGMARLFQSFDTADVICVCDVDDKALAGHQGSHQRTARQNHRKSIFRTGMAQALWSRTCEPGWEPVV